MTKSRNMKQEVQEVPEDLIQVRIEKINRLENDVMKRAPVYLLCVIHAGQGPGLFWARYVKKRQQGFVHHAMHDACSWKMH